jgi:hypothetical protein
MDRSGCEWRVVTYFQENQAMKKLLAAMLLVAVVAVIGCGQKKEPAKTAPPAGEEKKTEQPAETPKAP